MADHASRPWHIFKDCTHWGNHQKLSNNFCNAWKAFSITNIQAHRMEAYVNSYADLCLLLYCGRISHTACPRLQQKQRFSIRKKLYHFVMALKKEKKREAGEEEMGFGMGQHG